MIDLTGLPSKVCNGMELLDMERLRVGEILTSEDGTIKIKVVPEP